MTTFLRTAALAAVAASACAALPALAAPRVINACQVINEPGSYVVNRNLNANGDCLVINADFVTIDLDGFVLTGSGVGAGVAQQPLFTVRRGITVRNGVITGFNMGVSLPDTLGVMVERVHATGNVSTGIVTGSAATVRDSQSVSNGGDGIRVGTGGNVAGNITSRNGATGISTVEGAAVLNNVSRNNGARGVFMDCPGLFMGNVASNNPGGNFFDVSGGCVVDEHNSTL